MTPTLGDPAGDAPGATPGSGVEGSPSFGSFLCATLAGSKGAVAGAWTAPFSTCLAGHTLSGVRVSCLVWCEFPIRLFLYLLHICFANRYRKQTSSQHSVWFVQVLIIVGNYMCFQLVNSNMNMLVES